MKREVGDMRNYALITTAFSALLLGFTFSGNAHAEDALAGTLPGSTGTAPAAEAAATTASAPAATGSAQVFVPAAGANSASANPAPLPSASSPVTGTAVTGTTVTGTTGSAPSTSASSTIVPVTSAATATLSGGSAITATSGNGLTTSPATPQIVQDAMTRLQKVDQINLDDMIRAQDAINRLDLLLEIEKRQTELKKIRDERNKPAVTAAVAAGLLGSAIPASALNLPKLSMDSPASSSASASSIPAYTPKSSRSSGSSESSSGPSDKYSIKRITGADGRYFAVVNTDDNGSQTVHAGDKLPDGSLVKSVSLTSVSLFKDKKSKTLTIPTDSYIVRESGSSSQ
jgi:type IV pilus biogenesis protein PilP